MTDTEIAAYRAAAPRERGWTHKLACSGLGPKGCPA